MVNICVIALVGLPASGKTTFCQQISESVIEFNVIHVCYDEIFTFLPLSNELTFKEERRKVLQKIEQTLQCIESKTHPKHSSSKDYVIICDDNNYYSGMRYQIYKMCKEHQVSFGQIYFPIDLENALARNCLRGSKALPPSVIEQMNSRLEEPSTKNHWERHTLTIRSSWELEGIRSFLRLCLNNPLTSISRDEPINSEKLSVVHEIDIVLRKRIKELLQAAEGDLSTRAKVLNERRKSILLDARKKHASEEVLDIEGALESLVFD